MGNKVKLFNEFLNEKEENIDDTILNLYKNINKFKLKFKKFSNIEIEEEILELKDHIEEFYDVIEIYFSKKELPTIEKFNILIKKWFKQHRDYTIINSLNMTIEFINGKLNKQL